MNDNIAASHRHHFLELDDSPAAGAQLAAFYAQLYVPEFPDADERESLENMLAYLRKKAQGWYGDNNYHILILYLDGQPAGASIFDYFAQPNTGVIEFLFVANSQRGLGLGKKLLEETERVLIGDAKRAGHAALDYMAAEMNAPELTDPAEDNMEPAVRAGIWQRWGFRRADFRYVQPALSDEQQPVDNLCWIIKPSAHCPATQVPAAIVRQSLHDYLYWAMRIERPENNIEFQRMKQALAARESITLIDLA